MSLFGMMRTGVSGMGAQSNALSAISDNISNSDTTGYKEATTQFMSLLQNTDPSNYSSGGVNTTVRYDVTTQGVVQGTSSTTDLAINGDGFFLVNNSSGTPYLTRAGSFVPDASGNLVNAAGFYLMGYDLGPGGSTGVANGLTGMTKVNINQAALQAAPSTSGVFTANLPSDATAVIAANLPSTNSAGATYTAKTSIVAYGDLGNAVTLDVYFTKTSGNTWEAAVYNQADAAPGSGFPYSSAALTTQTLNFDPLSGNLASTSASAITIPVPGGQSVDLDLSKMTQLGAAYTPITATVNGNAPSPLDHVLVATDGTLYSVYQDGSRIATYKIPLANVPSPDNLTPETGNVYSTSIGSGDIVVGTAGAGGLGQIDSSSLEQSTVDLATELTNMIEAQRAYTANSKVFQTGADLMEVVVNLRSQ